MALCHLGLLTAQRLGESCARTSHRLHRQGETVKDKGVPAAACHLA